MMSGLLNVITAMLTLYLWHVICRSVRENSSLSGKQTSEEKENDD